MSLEELEQELYKKKSVSRRAGSRARVVGGMPPISAPEEVKKNISRKEEPEEEIQEEEIHEGRKFMSLKTVLIAGGIFLLLAGFLGIMLFISKIDRTPEPVLIKVYAPSEIYRGVPFEMEVQAVNDRDALIGDAVLTLNLPSGVINAGGLQGINTLVTEPLGDIGAGGTAKRTFKLLGVGSLNSIQKISINLSYTALGKARFETQGSHEITIKNPAVQVEIKKPEYLLQGSAFDIEITYKNLSDFDFPELVLEAQYPTAFKFISASLPPDSLNNTWRLGALRAGSSGSLQIRGTLSFSGGDDVRFSIPIAIKETFLGQGYSIAEDVVTLALAPSPVHMTFSVNGREDYLAHIGDTLNYSIKYENRSGIALADVVIKATPTGDLFDFGTFSTNGSVNSVNNTIIWNAATTPELKLLGPSATGEVTFSLALKPIFPIRRLNDKNFYLRVNAEIDSPSVPYYLKAQSTSAKAIIETKVAGLTFVDARAFYRDALSGIVNVGKLPPRVNQATEYTIHWVIRNYSTDIRNVSVRAILQPGVQWTGAVKSNSGFMPLYNERTQEVTWSIDKIAATRGVLSEPVEAIFQVRAIPNITQVGNVEPLLGETSLKATDDFTGLEITTRDLALDTSLPDDTTVVPGGGIVEP